MIQITVDIEGIKYSHRWLSIHLKIQNNILLFLTYSVKCQYQVDKNMIKVKFNHFRRKCKSTIYDMLMK